MKKTHFLSSFFLARGRGLVRSFLAFFRFTETDACTLLSAYGLHGLEVDRLQNDRANEQKELSKSATRTRDSTSSNSVRSTDIAVCLEAEGAGRFRKCEETSAIVVQKDKVARLG
jgi:hypothetical protein